MTTPKPKSKAPQTGAARPERPETRMMRAQRMLELQVKGVPTQDIADAHKMSLRGVKKTIKWGVDHGAADVVRDRMQAQLDKIPNIYAEILGMDANDLSVTDMAMKIRTLQLKAAQQLADGMGVFQKQEKTTTTVATSMDLDQFYKLRAARAAGVLPPSDLPSPAPALPEQTAENGEFTEEVPDGES